MARGRQAANTTGDTNIGTDGNTPGAVHSPRRRQTRAKRGAGARSGGGGVSATTTAHGMRGRTRNVSFTGEQVDWMIQRGLINR